MQLILNEEEQMVRESAQSFLADNAGPCLLREIRDSNNSLGYSEKLWQQMIELGWPSLLIPEQFDGLGFSHVAMVKLWNKPAAIWPTLQCSQQQSSVFQYYQRKVMNSRNHSGFPRSPWAI